MKSVVFVTGNKGKYFSAKKRCEDKGIELVWENIDLDEMQVNDITQISRDKARQAFQILNKPCFVIDSGFYIDNYPNNPGYPGAFVKRSGIANNPDMVLEVMRDVRGRSCKFVDALTFYDGEDFYTFYDVDYGTLSEEVKGSESELAKSKLWYLYIPLGYDKALAQMSEEELFGRKSSRVSSIDKFLDWYVSEYKNTKRLSK